MVKEDGGSFCTGSYPVKQVELPFRLLLVVEVMVGERCGSLSQYRLHDHIGDIKAGEYLGREKLCADG